MLKNTFQYTLLKIYMYVTNDMGCWNRTFCMGTGTFPKQFNMPVFSFYCFGFLCDTLSFVTVYTWLQKCQQFWVHSEFIMFPIKNINLFSWFVQTKGYIGCCKSIDCGNKLIDYYSIRPKYSLLIFPIMFTCVCTINIALFSPMGLCITWWLKVVWNNNSTLLARQTILIVTTS